MRALLFVVNSFTYIVQKSRALCKVHVKPKLLSHKPRKLRNLDRVLVHVLPVAGSVFKSAQKLDNFGMQSENAHLKHRALARLLDFLLHFLFDLFNRFLYSCRVNSAVGNQLFKRKSCNLAPYGVKAGKYNHLGSVVDNQLYTRCIFNRADISALSADKSCLHVVAGQGYNRYGNFRGMVCRATLNGKRDNLLCLGCRLFPCGLLYISYLQRHVMTGFVKNFRCKQLSRLFTGELCNLFQLLNHKLVLVRDLFLSFLNFKLSLFKLAALLLQCGGLL